MREWTPYIIVSIVPTHFQWLQGEETRKEFYNKTINWWVLSLDMGCITPRSLLFEIQIRKDEWVQVVRKNILQNMSKCTLLNEIHRSKAIVKLFCASFKVHECCKSEEEMIIIKSSIEGIHNEVLHRKNSSH